MSDLEPRILLSATPIDLGSLPGSVPAAMVVQVESAVPESESVSAEPAVTQQAAGEIIIIDSAVPQLQQLLDDLSRSGRNAEVVILDADHDGLDQITQVLDSRTDIESIHIVSHAESGAVKLGNLWLSESNLSGYAGQIAAWQSSLTTDADILFYGCDLADSTSGRTLIESISAISGADVAASTDDTGHSDFAGNWELEYHTGAIESNPPFSSDIQQNWAGKLSTITVDTYADVISGADGLTTLREAILQVNAGAGGETILLAAGTYTLSIAGVGDNLALTGDLDINTAVTIVGDNAASTIIDGNGIDRVFDVYPGFGGVTFSGMTIQGGNAATGNGGGINVNGGADVTVIDTWITNNTAEQGGGLHTVGSLVVERSTVSGNTAASEGGGIMVTGGGGTLDLTNVTVSSNTAANGGAIRTSNTISVTNSTIAFNTGTISIGGILTGGTGDAVLLNTILSNNTGGNADSSLTSTGHNIDSDGTASISNTGDLSGTIPAPLDPLLGLLQNNGGFTPTHAITMASPAYNAGTTIGAPVIDQRGDTRDAFIDIGAFEVITTNDSPTDIVPNSFSIDENLNTTGGTSVGTLVASDPDAGETFTWEVVGGTDQSKFTTSGNQLMLDDGTLDFETQSSYSVAVRVTDSAMNTYNETLIVNVNDINEAPTVSTTAGFLNFTENDPATPIDSGLIITEPDGANMISGQITIASGYVSGQDTLTFTNQLGITGAWNAGTGILTLTGNASAADYQTALRTVSYINGSEAPDEATRTIDFQVSDGIAFGSGSRFVNVSAVNDMPVMSNVAGDSLNYTAGVGAEIIEQASDVTVGDLDSTNFDSGNLTVSVVAGGDDAEDLLSIRDQGISAGQIGFDGTNVRFGGTLIGVASGGTNGTPLVVSLNSNSTTIATAALIRNISYENLDAVTPTTGARTVRFVVDDGDGGTSLNHDATVTVFAANIAPTDISPNSLSIDENTDTTGGYSLGTLAATDPDTGETFNWSIQPGGDDNVFSIVAGSGELTLDDGLLDFESKSSYLVNVRVTDSAGSTYDETLTVTINDQNDNPPDVDPSQSFDISEFAANGSSLGIVTAADADTSTTFSNWTITSGNEQGIFVIDSNTGELIVFDDTNLDFEATAGYTLGITVSDGTNTSVAQTIEINVVDENDAPSDITLDSSNVNENADGAVIGKLGVFDADVADTHNLIVDDLRFEIAGTQLKLKAGQTLDRETEPTVNLTITATDQAGAGLAYNEGFVITVDNVNEVATDITVSSTNVPELTDGAVVGNVGVVDPDAGDTHTWSVDDTRFEIVAGQLKLKAGQTLNRVTEPTVNFTLTATDQAGIGLAYNEAFVVTVDDVNQAPTDITLDHTSVNENADGAIIGNLGVADPDIDDIHAWNVDDSRFEVVGTQLKLKAGQTVDHETEPTVSLNIEVYDQGGAGLVYNEAFAITVTDINEPPKAVDDIHTGLNEGAIHHQDAPGVLANDTDVDGDTLVAMLVTGPSYASTFSLHADGSYLYQHDGSETTSDGFTYRVTDGVAFSSIATVILNITPSNDAPVDISLDNLAISENAVAAVIGTLAVVDPDIGDSHTWSVDDARFEIIAGQLKLKGAQALDRETEPTVNLVITVTDQGGAGAAYSEAFVVSVVDVNEMATDITLDNTHVAEQTDEAFVGNLGVIDPDFADTHTWSVDDLRFQIAGGQLKLIPGQTLDMITEPTISLMITVTDQGGTGLAYNELFVLTVDNVNQPPTDITLDNTSINENAAGAVIGNLGVDDPDIGDTHSWSVNDARFEIVGGQLKLKSSESIDFESEPAISLTLTATDQAGTGFAIDESFSLTINDTNEPPTANANTYTVLAGQSLQVAVPGVLAADSDPEGDPLSALLIAGPANGSLTLGVDGSFVYVPKIGFVGNDSFVYQATDNVWNSPATLVTITVKPPGIPTPSPPPIDTDEDDEVDLLPPPPPPPADAIPPDDSTPVVETAPETSADRSATANPSTLAAALVQPIPAEQPLTVFTGVKVINENLAAGSPDDDSQQHPAEKKTANDDFDGLRSQPANIYRITSDDPQWRSLDLFRDEVLGDWGFQSIVVGSAVSTSIGFSVGYVLWTVRAGWLASALMTSMPVWRSIDPLPVLEYVDGEVDPTDDETLQSIVQHQVQ